MTTPRKTSLFCHLLTDKDQLNRSYNQNQAPSVLSLAEVIIWQPATKENQEGDILQKQKEN